MLALMTAALGLAAPAAAGRDDAAGEVEIVLVHDTHLHGSFSRPDGVTLAHYAGVVEEILDAHPHALFVGNGDDLGPSVMSAEFQGQHIVEAFNAARLTADTFGNHELDYGPENLVEQIRRSAFSWVSANVVDRRTGEVFGAEAGAAPFVLRQLAGVVVGFTGVAPAETATISNAGPDLLVLDPVEAVGDLVPRMRGAGAQIVVVLSHLDGPDTEQLAASVDGIDALVGDHGGQALDVPKVINGAVVSRRGQEYDRVGVLTLRVRAGQVVDHLYWWLPVGLDSPISPEVQGIIDWYDAELAARLDREVGHSATALDARREVVRAREAALGNLIADAMRAWGGADVAIQNGGGIRGDRVYEAGPLSRATIVEWLPFPNYVTVLRLSGAELLEALENGVSTVEAGGGRFPQVSGLAFRYDPRAPPLARVREVVVGGARLDRDAAYTVATNDFLAGGGDGYTVFRQAEVIVPPQAGPLLSALVTDAVSAAATIDPRVEGRISTE